MLYRGQMREDERENKLVGGRSWSQMQVAKVT